MKPHYQTKKQLGFSIIELMIGMVLGLVLIAAVVQLFVANKATYRTMEGLSRIQENARFTFDFMSRDIRMAGFTGCYQGASGDIENILNDQTNLGWDLNNMLSGYNNVDGAFSAVPNVVVGTDVIIIRAQSDDGITLVDPYSDSAHVFIDDAATGFFVPGDILMITDCSQSTIFQVSTEQPAGSTKINIVHSSAGTIVPGNSTPQKANVFGPGTEIARLNTYAYYIRLNPAGNRALYRSRLASSATGGATTTALTAEELIEGVENMQVEYGEDTSGDQIPDSYVNAANVTNWSNVITVRTGLLFNSIDNARSTADTTTYLLSADTTYDPPNDRQLRKVFSNVTAIRKKLPE